VRAVRECCSVAEDYGVVIAVQNHHDIGVAWESYLEFLNDVDHPNCRAAFDPWSPALHGDDLRACAKALAPRMIQTTLADYVKLRRFAYQTGVGELRATQRHGAGGAVGARVRGSRWLLRGIERNGFDGYVVYEMCSPLRGEEAWRIWTTRRASAWRRCES